MNSVQEFAELVGAQALIKAACIIIKDDHGYKGDDYAIRLLAQARLTGWTALEQFDMAQFEDGYTNYGNIYSVSYQETLIEYLGLIAERLEILNRKLGAIE